MAENKTKPTETSAIAFLKKIDDPTVREGLSHSPPDDAGCRGYASGHVGKLNRRFRNAPLRL